MKTYEILDTTGDIGLIAYGKDEEELIKNTIDGFYNITFSEPLNYETCKENIEIESSSLQETIFLLLEEMIFYLYAKRTVFRYKKLIKDSNYNIILELLKTNSEIEIEIKGVTKHKYSVVKDKNRYILKVIFDI